MTNRILQKDFVIRSTVIIAVFSLLSKILGLVRDAVFSHQFGASTVVDAYFAAFRIPDFIFNLLILGTFSVAFIPIFSKYLQKDEQQAQKLASSILNVTILGILIMSVLAFVFINPLINLIAPGFEGEAFELTKLFTTIFLLSPIFLTLSSVVSSILNAYKRFALVAFAPVIYNASIILGVVVFYPLWGLTGLACGVILGAFLHFAIQLPSLARLPFRYSLNIDFKIPGFANFWKLYWPRIFSMGTNQITFLIATFFGSYLAAGSLSAFYYANNLQSVFLSIFAVSAAVVAFPILSDLYNQQDHAKFKDVIAKTSIQILFFIIPLSVIMLILRAQIVRLVLGIGQNTSLSFDETRMIASTFGLFVVSLFGQGLIPLFARAFYARHDTKSPVIISIVVLIINFVVTYFLASLGVTGIALAFSITSIIHVLLLVMELHRKIGSFHDGYLILNTLKILIGSTVAGLVAFLTLYIVGPLVDTYTYIGIFIQASLSFGFAISGYLLTAFILELSEAHQTVGLVKNMFMRFIRAFSISQRGPEDLL